MSMTKKDYEMVAEAIAVYSLLGMGATIYDLIDELTSRFSQDNPKFDPIRFSSKINELVENEMYYPE